MAIQFSCIYRCLICSYVVAFLSDRIFKISNFQVTEGERAELNKVIQVRVNPARVPRNVRVCTLSNFTAKDMELVIKKWLYVLKEMAV